MADDTRKYNVHADYITYKHDGSIVWSISQPNGSAQVGLAVNIKSDDTVGLVTDGQEIDGVVTRVNSDGFCTVQDTGYTDVDTDGTAITYGNGLVGGATNGKVKTATAVPAAGKVRTAQAIKSDGTNHIIMRIR